MKKLTAFLMSMLLVFSFAACSSTNPDNDSPATTPDTSIENDTNTTPNENETEPTDSTDTAKKNVLVVYYSATGSTERVAGYIADAADGDTFELIPADEYSSADLNYGDQSSRVVYEHEHPDERDIELVEDTVENWDDYDIIFIGYPIWWQIAAWPVDGFVKANDFTGKTVIPFCTSASSGLGDSGKLLEEMAGTGSWLEGQRFSSGASESIVKNWLDSLELD